MTILTRGEMKSSGELESAIRLPKVTVIICMCPYYWMGKRISVNQMSLLGGDGQVLGRAS